MKKYVLPLARNYVAHWGLTEAVREFLQNYIDGGEWTHEFGESFLSLYSPAGKLDPSTLVLGTTSKADDTHSIGSFGEGYKIALLVLARLGYEVKIYNNGKLWEPCFELSESFGCEVLTIQETDWECSGLRFDIHGLTRDDIEKVIESCLQLQPALPYEDFIAVTQGQILLNNPGALYVNGLWICKTEAEYGYNIKPEFIALERDRQTVDGFKLQWLLKDMWCETKQWDRIAAMVAGEVFDVEHAHYKGIPELDAACLKVFDQQQSPAKTIASSPQEAASSGGSYYNVGMYNSVARAPAYAARVAKPKTPTDMLNDWLEANKKHMRHRGVGAFKELLETTKTWKL